MQYSEVIMENSGSPHDFERNWNALVNKLQSLLDIGRDMDREAFLRQYKDQITSVVIELDDLLPFWEQRAREKGAWLDMSHELRSAVAQLKHLLGLGQSTLH